MGKPGLHSFENDTREGWLEDFAAQGVAALEALLQKHAAFHDYLERRRRP